MNPNKQNKQLDRIELGVYIIAYIVIITNVIVPIVILISKFVGGMEN